MTVHLLIRLLFGWERISRDDLDKLRSELTVVRGTPQLGPKIEPDRTEALYELLSSFNDRFLELASTHVEIVERCHSDPEDSGVDLSKSFSGGDFDEK